MRITAEEGLIPSTVAQQLFTIGGGMAGAVAGMITARELADRPTVPMRTVVGATAISVLFTIGAALILRKQVREEY